MLLGETASGRSAGLHRLEGMAVGDPAADLEDDLAQRHAHGNLNQTGVSDLSGQGEDLGSLAALRANAGVPLRPLADDGSDIGEGLDVVDESRAAPQTGDRRVRRSRPRLTAQPFDGGNEGGLLAADECAGSESDLDVEGEGGAADVAFPGIRGGAPRAERR